MNCRARVLLVRDFLQVGLALIEGPSPAFCLFRTSHFVKQRGNPASLTQWAPEGTRIRLHAKKEDNSRLVAYLATSVWFEGEDYEQENCSLLYQPTLQEDRDTFARVADDLTWGINAAVSTARGKHNIFSVLEKRVRRKKTELL